MSIRRLSWIFALCMVLAVGCGGGVAIHSPHTINNAKSVDVTEQVILDTLPKRGWTAESVQPGRIVAFLSVRKHLLRTEIRYDPNQVNIFYVDSDNLAAHVESDGRVYAHPKVNAWIGLLARDIANALNAARPAAPATVAPPSPPPT